MHKDYKVNLFAFAYRLFHKDFSPIYALESSKCLLLNCIASESCH